MLLLFFVLLLTLQIEHLTGINPVDVAVAVVSSKAMAEQGDEAFILPDGAPYHLVFLAHIRNNYNYPGSTSGDEGEGLGCFCKTTSSVLSQYFLPPPSVTYSRL